MTATEARWVPTLAESSNVPDDCVGVLKVRILPGTDLAEGTLYFRSGQDLPALKRLDTWAIERLARLVEHGEALDGWGEFDDSGTTVLQLYARDVELPSL